MEDTKRRWCVTYTKHMKQKRKVYQDGFIDLHISTNKVKLYDGCEKLLECRILKKDEIISCGETLAFNAYFVDVGDPEGNHKPIRDSNLQGRDKKVIEQPNLSCRQRFGNKSFASDGKIDGEKKKAQPNCTSPSQKIIREFKKRELEKYGTPQRQSSPDMKEIKTTEWQVLYTTQLTQKAKKYHDGFLRLKICGSQGRQILLFDEAMKLLDRRFLRRDEEIKSSESVAFDGHLVEIGELEENREPLADLNVHRNNSNIAGKAEALHRQQNYIKNINSDGKEFRKSEVSRNGAPQSSPDTKNSSTNEWQVMYTTQVTQKSKKYHDGFLRLAVIGSFQRQVMLYDDGRKLLNSRFLKKDEVIKSGESISFDAHLVDIGEPQEHQLQMDVNLEGFNSSVVQKTEIMHKQQNDLGAYKYVIKGKSQNTACSSKNTESTLSISSEGKKSIPTNNPLRDASQILSILQRPMTENSIDVGCTDNSRTRQLSSIKEVEVSDVVDHKSCKNLTVGRPNEDTETGNCRDLLSSVAKSTCNGSQISKDYETGNFNQSQLDVKAGDKSNEEVDERKSSEKLNTAREMEEFPSFDLGF
ncbi:hypothetical protein Ddye_002901 [Dipteronia dyeriana]|uniref:5'-3' DNA helicase ZGRF1-like N-terminal domain-containing protein n=1 Tax=Dipteronia dyeriana TaxID=168575 RepID=A0AAD9XRR9_9ROSI|nr:hypothetical protein Ddye_002901 [Dipteronia dyeriana]